MGFFSFLEPKQQDPGLEKAKGFVPEGWKVRRKGEDFFRNEETEAGADDELRAPDNIPKATAEEMKPYTQRRGETTSKVFQAADQIIGKYEKLSPDLKGIADQTRREVQANPENAAKAVEKFHKAVIKQTLPLQQTGFEPPVPDLYDQSFSALESNVRNLRTMKRGAEERSLTGGLAETDLKKNLSELQNLKGQLDTVTKDIAGAQDTMPEAVSGRGEEENKKTLAAKQQQAAAIAEHIKQLESVTKPAQPEDQGNTAFRGGWNPNPAQPAGTPATATANADNVGAFAGGTAGASMTPVTKYMDGLGIPREALVEKLHTALKGLGIPREQWESNDVDPSAGLMRVLSELDKNGNFAQMVSGQLAAARQQDATDKESQKTPSDPRIAQTERQIQSREMRMKQLYSDLRQTPFMQTWPGLILYVLVSLVTKNPAFAAKLVGGVGGNLAGDIDKNAVNSEIKGIQYEINHLDHRLENQQRMEVETKREAARRLQHKDDEVSSRKWELSKLMLNHNLIIQRNAKRGDPNTFLLKKMSGDFQRNLGMASKFSGEMQNEFADPKVREAARTNFNLYMRRAAELDADIRKFGGSATENATEAEQE